MMQNVFPIEQYLSTFHRHEKHLSNKNFWHQEYGLPFYIKVPLLLDSVVRNENQSEPPSAPEELASLLLYVCLRRNERFVHKMSMMWSGFLRSLHSLLSTNGHIPHLIYTSLHARHNEVTTIIVLQTYRNHYH